MRRLSPSLVLLALALALPASAQEAAEEGAAETADEKVAKKVDAQTGPKGNGKLAITWLGHAAFEVVTPGGTRLLIDPFLKENPATPAAFKSLARYRPDAILVSHSHADHKGDSEEIAAASGAKVIGAFELIGAMDVAEGQKMGGNVGGQFQVGDATIHLVPAMHGSEPGGRPLGFVIEVGAGEGQGRGRSIYHTGDTWIFTDMKLIHEIHRPEILLLNTGGGPFTQSPEVAKRAVRKFFRPKTIIPMHYGTFPPLATEDDVKEAFGRDRRLKILQPGETAEL